MNNWKDKLGKEWWADDKQGGWTIAGGDIQNFISTEIIEKLIEEIPDGKYVEGVQFEFDELKQQLKAKWLGETK